MQKVRPTVSCVPDFRKVGPIDAIAFVYGNSMSSVPKDQAEVEDEDTAVIERDMTDARSEDEGHVQVDVSPDKN